MGVGGGVRGGGASPALPKFTFEEASNSQRCTFYGHVFLPADGPCR